MTFIRLSKPEPATDPEHGPDLEDETPGEAGDDDQAQPAAQPVGLLGAVVQGVRGWFTWCSSRIGSGRTYTAHLVALWAAAYYSAWVTCALITGLALAVSLFIPREPLDRLAARIERLGTRHRPGPDTPPDETDAREDQAAEVTLPDPLRTLLWRLIGSARGVHLKTLVQVLAAAAEEAGQQAPSRAEVEAALEARGIPLRASVRDAQDRVNRGVHRADLEAAVKAPPPLTATDPAPDV